MQNPLYSPLRCLSTALGWRALGRLSDHCYLGYNRTSALPQSACLRLLPSTAAAGRNPQNKLRPIRLLIRRQLLRIENLLRARFVSL